MSAGDGSSAGVRVWICASSEVHRVPLLSRWEAVPLLLLVILNTNAALVESVRDAPLFHTLPSSDTTIEKHEKVGYSPNSNTRWNLGSCFSGDVLGSPRVDSFVDPTSSVVWLC